LGRLEKEFCISFAQLLAATLLKIVGARSMSEGCPLPARLTSDPRIALAQKPVVSTVTPDVNPDQHENLCND